MNNKCTISLKDKDGTYYSILCHWGGTPDMVGKILQNNYNDITKIVRLLEWRFIRRLVDNENDPGYKTEDGQDTDRMWSGHKRHPLIKYSNMGSIPHINDKTKHHYLFDNGWKLLIDNNFVEFVPSDYIPDLTVKKKKVILYRGGYDGDNFKISDTVRDKWLKERDPNVISSNMREDKSLIKIIEDMGDLANMKVFDDDDDDDEQKIEFVIVEIPSNVEYSIQWDNWGSYEIMVDVDWRCIESSEWDEDSDDISRMD